MNVETDNDENISNLPGEGATEEKENNLYAPQFTNVEDNEIVHQKIFLVIGRAGNRDTYFEGTIVVKHEDLPTLQYPISNSHFKAMVMLVPGYNNFTFEFHDPVTQNFYSTELHMYYLPLLQNPPLHLAILVASDSEEVFDVPRYKDEYSVNGLDKAIEKLRCVAYMWQAFTSEQMNRQGFGRRTFRLEECWLEDTMLQSRELSSTAKVYVIRTEKTVNELRAKDCNIYDIFLEALKNYGSPFYKICYVAGLILDSHYDKEADTILGHQSLGGGSGHIGLGIFGSQQIHTWPTCLEEIVPCLTDNTSNDPIRCGSKLGGSNSNFRCFNYSAGAMLHEIGHCLSLTHSPTGIMSNGYQNFNRAFVSWEPGRRGIAPSEEKGAHWHRFDCIRFRYHPCFRLPNDAIQYKKLIDSPTFYYTQSGVTVKSESGIILVEYWIDNKVKCYKDYSSDYLDEIPNELLISMKDIGRSNIHNKKLKVNIISTNCKCTTIEDLAGFIENRNPEYHRLHGTFYRSYEVGLHGLEVEKHDTQPFSIIFKTTISRIVLYGGTFFNGFKIVFTNGHESKIVHPEGDNKRVLSFYNNDSIAKIYVRASTWIDGMEIELKSGVKSGWCGGYGGELYILSPPSNHQIVGLYGTGKKDHWLDSFGIKYVKKSEDNTIESIPASEMNVTHVTANKSSYPYNVHDNQNANAILDNNP